LLEAQAYRLSYWRVAVDEINYRRFFDVNNLAALRMDEREVFESAHALIFELIDEGKIDGLRIDHSDGLYDPQAYFERLQRRYAHDDDLRPLYVVTEKILAAHERLPENWLVHGTTGYEFAALATGWLVCSEEEARLTRRYRTFTDDSLEFDDLVYRTKMLVMHASLAAEVETLATQLDRIAQLDRHTEDFTRASLRGAIIEVIARFPVYRTYISQEGASEEDRRIVNWAIGIARGGSPIEQSVFDFLRDVLLGDAAVERPELRRAMREFAMKFQQVTSPVTAKGVEDTAFYRFNRLICLNEVGSEPRRFGVSTAAVHQANLERAKSWPYAMLASTTHDTKRSEDVRARIAVISELPDHWKLHLSRWSKLNAGKRREVNGTAAPSRSDEYMLYQTLAGFWEPNIDSAILIERLQGYLIKAAREAKRSTSWLTPNAEYEKALCDFSAQLLENPDRNAFLRDFTTFVEPIVFFGGLNSLIQTALKLTSPGVPDIYQGTEGLSLSLVDPDNRRPVDYELGARELGRVERSDGASLLPDISAAKLWVTWKLLQLRQALQSVFAGGGYTPLQVEGDKSEHVIAFARTGQEQTSIVVLPRWCARLKAGAMELPLGEATWGETAVLAPLSGSYKDAFTGRRFQPYGATEDRRLRLAELLETFPLAVLVSESET
jgi:(1->4)-alpha-D-glucan 1-alpha-D-glucosylmutase